MITTTDKIDSLRQLGWSEDLIEAMGDNDMDGADEQSFDITECLLVEQSVDVTTFVVG